MTLPINFSRWLFFFFNFILFIYFWLCWVFVSVRGLSLVVASGGHSSSRCAGLSSSRLLLLRSTGSRRAGSVIVAHGPSCSVACGIFPDQGSNPCPLHWQADSQPLRHQGSPSRWLLTAWVPLLLSHLPSSLSLGDDSSFPSKSLFPEFTLEGTLQAPSYLKPLHILSFVLWVPVPPPYPNSVTPSRPPVPLVTCSGSFPRAPGLNYSFPQRPVLVLCGPSHRCHEFLILALFSPSQ